jgi:hypothetical protein
MKRAWFPIVIVVASGLLVGAEPTPVAKHFSHADHQKRGVKTDDCDSCHTIDAQGITITPGATGHSPCLNAACHAADFIASGTKAQPAQHQKAVSFCLGCHPSAKNEPPPAWTKPTPVAIATHGPSEYHVEMNHFEHTKRTNCRTCHIVDGKSLALVADRPGHHECVLCHNPQKYPEFTMSKCGLCHSTPSRVEFFPKVNRPSNNVRACNSEGYLGFARKHPGQKLACFTHERPEHRMQNGKEVQCGTCHFMVDDPHLGPRYNSIAKLHELPVIEDDAGRAHRSCGNAAACHKNQVPPNATSHCGVCHDDQVAGGALGD